MVTHNRAIGGIAVVAAYSALANDPSLPKPESLTEYELPEDIDPRGNAWPAQVERATYDRARDTREVQVRVLPSPVPAWREPVLLLPLSEPVLLV